LPTQAMLHTAISWK